MNKENTHPASLDQLAGSKGKGKAPRQGHENSTPGPSCLPERRKLPTLVPKPAGINSGSPRFSGGGSLPKRARVDEHPESSSYLLQSTHPTMETMSVTNGTESHMGSNTNTLCLVSESNIQSMTNEVQTSENHMLAAPLDHPSGAQNEFQMERPWSLPFQNTFTSHHPPPPIIPQISPPSYRASKICAACDERLVTLRNHIKAIPDTAVSMQILDVYFGLRDNWHGCHQQGFGGLDG